MQLSLCGDAAALCLQSLLLEKEIFLLLRRVFKTVVVDKGGAEAGRVMDFMEEAANQMLKVSIWGEEDEGLSAESWKTSCDRKLLILRILRYFRGDWKCLFISPSSTIIHNYRSQQF